MSGSIPFKREGPFWTDILPIIPRNDVEGVNDSSDMIEGVGGVVGGHGDVQVASLFALSMVRGQFVMATAPTKLGKGREESPLLDIGCASVKSLQNRSKRFR